MRCQSGNGNARPQFSLKTMLVLLLAVACFFGGIHFERERRRREDAKTVGDDWGCLVPSGGNSEDSSVEEVVSGDQP